MKHKIERDRRSSSSLYVALLERGLSTRYVVLDARLGSETVLDGETILERFRERIGYPETHQVGCLGYAVSGSDVPLLRELPPWIDVRTFGPRAEAEFDELTMHAEPCSGDDYETAEAEALYAALGLPTSSEEECLYRLPDGGLALIGCAVEGHSWAYAGPSYDFSDGETTEEGGRFLTDEDALAGLREWVRDGDYTPDNETVYVAARIIQGDRTVEESVRVDPEPPPCERLCEHEFAAPVEIVGGDESNPGVFGHDGGARVVRVCLICGCKRTLDTWGTDRSTGREGVRVVTYEEDFYRAEVEAYREKRAWVEYPDPRDGRMTYRCDRDGRYWQVRDDGGNPPTWRDVSEDDVPSEVFDLRQAIREEE